MKELVKVEINENHEPIISGRELHEKLEIKTPYTQWIDRMLEYGFSENIDFTLHSQKCESSNISGVKVIQNHNLTLDTAKEICMLQRNEKGKQFRQYFIQVEKEYNSPEKIMARALKIAENKLLETNIKIEQLENKIENDKSKVIFAEALEVSKTSILVGELAKLIKQNGVDIGANRLFEWLRNNGYLGKSGENYNLPTQKSMNLGLMEIKKTVINNPDGSTRTTKTPKITGKGQSYFVNKFLKAKEIN